MASEPTIRDQRSRLAQSRIDYIVFGNPKLVGNLVYDYGYERPKSLSALSEAVHTLIRTKGKKVVLDLIKLHPDKQAILSAFKDEGGKENSTENSQSGTTDETSATKPAPTDESIKMTSNKCSTCGKDHQSYDSFCGCNHSYNEGNEDLSNVGVNELRKRFLKLTEQSEADPQNKKLADEATKVWNEIRIRNQSSSETARPLFSISPRDGVAILLLAIIAGILIGYAANKVKQYAKS